MMGILLYGKESAGTLLLALAMALFSVWLARFLRHNPIGKVPGPKADSLVLGHLPQLERGRLGQSSDRWFQEFGGIVRLRGFCGTNMLHITDPAALATFFGPAEPFVMSDSFRAKIHMITGPGLLWVRDQEHRRHKRIMQPGFGPAYCKELVPVFTAHAEQLTEKLQSHVIAVADGVASLDVYDFVVRTTLDILTDAAFGMKVNAIDSPETRLATVYRHMLEITSSNVPDSRIVIGEVLPLLPTSWRRLLSRVSKDFRTMYDTVVGSRKDASEIAATVIRDRIAALKAGEPLGKDALSLMIKANLHPTSKTFMAGDEVLAEMTTLFLAGQDTIASSTSWVLKHLADSHNKRYQDLLREEILAKRAECGTEDFSAKDLDGMIWLNAIIKESSRVTPVVSHSYRQAKEDVVLPLSHPLRLITGERVREILVPKGTYATADLYQFNRLEEIWGCDAAEFKPERWLDPNCSPKIALGPVGGLLSFIAGPRQCLGWKFALVEQQCLLSKLILRLEFSVDLNVPPVEPIFCETIRPSPKGSSEYSLPLRVKLANYNA